MHNKTIKELSTLLHSKQVSATELARLAPAATATDKIGRAHV